MARRWRSSWSSSASVAALALWRFFDMSALLQRAADRGAVMATGTRSQPRAPAARTDWQALARRTGARGSPGNRRLLAFLVVVSLPILLPYFWLVTIAFSGRTGGVGERRAVAACAVIVPAVLVFCLVHMSVASRATATRDRPRSCSRSPATLLVALVGDRSASRQFPLPVARRFRRGAALEGDVGRAVSARLDRLRQLAASLA